MATVGNRWWQKGRGRGHGGASQLRLLAQPVKLGSSLLWHTLFSLSSHCTVLLPSPSLVTVRLSSCPEIFSHKSPIPVLFAPSVFISVTTHLITKPYTTVGNLALPQSLLVLSLTLAWHWPLSGASRATGSLLPHDPGLHIALFLLFFRASFSTFSGKLSLDHWSALPLSRVTIPFPVLLLEYFPVLKWCP